MRLREIAGTEVRVSEIGFGVWTLAAGWWGDHSDDEASALLRRAVDYGVTFLDTADTYGQGRGETLIAKAFPGSRRDGITIGAKFGYDWQARDASAAGQREAPHRFDIPFLEASLDASLRRMGTDRIDFYQMHNPRMAHLLDDDVWSFVDRARRAGKIRAVGVALGPAIGWKDEGLYALEQLPVHAVQMIYNALELDPGRVLIEAAERNGKSLVVRVPHSSGMLEGRYTPDTVFPEGDHRRHRPRSWLVEGLQKIEQLRFLERECRCTLSQAALRFVLHSPSVVSALPNIYDEAQLKEFAAASDLGPMTDAHAAAIEALYENNYGLPQEVKR